MIEIRRLSECTWKDAVSVWNEGFQDYFTDVKMNVDTFTARLAREGLSPALSIMAYHGGQPVGILLNGIRVIGSKRIAWNGGTAVVPCSRRLGVGKALVEAALRIYRENGVNIATLEAIRQNERAIALYRQMGYEEIDRLRIYRCARSLQNSSFREEGEECYSVRKGLPQDVARLPFYRVMAPWQTHWPSLTGGESFIVVDSGGEAAGYALCRRSYDPEGNLTGITLFQCETEPERRDGEAVMRSLLRKVFAPLHLPVKRTTINLPLSNRMAMELLEREGFSLELEQVHMILHC
jgi:GNAT superfamily N-acetyltransferase